jgi:hypothetical protein
LCSHALIQLSERRLKKPLPPRLPSRDKPKNGSQNSNCPYGPVHTCAKFADSCHGCSEFLLSQGLNNQDGPWPSRKPADRLAGPGRCPSRTGSGGLLWAAQGLSSLPTMLAASLSPAPFSNMRKIWSAACSPGWIRRGLWVRAAQAMNSWSWPSHRLMNQSIRQSRKRQAFPLTPYGQFPSLLYS